MFLVREMSCKILNKIIVPTYAKLSKRSIALYQKQLINDLLVPTFCNITVDVPFSINLEPLDVHKYRDCDRILIWLNNFNANEESIAIVRENNNISIRNSSLKETFSKDVSCTIMAPIKANLKVSSEVGDIKIKGFNSDQILATSVEGNITVDGYQGREIDIKTIRGDVAFRGVVQSSLINVLISDEGSAFINKLQGEKASIMTNFGNISVNSSYCKTSRFSIEQGDMKLKNIHGSCEVINKKSGNIKMTSFDGQLNLVQENGNADINLSRITDNSRIMVSKGNILLRLSEECQEQINFDIKSKNVNIHKDVRVKQVNANDTCYREESKTVSLNCENCSVDIEAASWFDMHSS